MVRPGKEGGMASSEGGSDEEEVIGDLALRVMSRWKEADLQVFVIIVLSFGRIWKRTDARTRNSESTYTLLCNLFLR